jgi:hypothetical protein
LRNEFGNFHYQEALLVSIGMYGQETEKYENQEIHLEIVFKKQ